MGVSPGIEAARKLRPAGAFHLPPSAQPTSTWVDLILENATEAPDVVLRDISREIELRVAMVEAGAQSYTVRILTPSRPTILRYHFEFPDGETLHERRQVEGRNTPIYGPWEERQFQIAVYIAEEMPAAWTRGQVIYQIFPDTFANGDTSTDRTSKGVYGQEPKYLAWDELPEHPPRGRDFHGGDLRGIIQKLDYLAALGVECIYLTPIFESPSNHRYDTLDYMQIEPMLGSEQDFDELLAQAHRRHIRIVLDAVFNHCSSDSRYFNGAGHYGREEGAAQSKLSKYYRWFEFKEWPAEYDGWIGLHHMPEFVECPEVEEFFIGPQGVAVHWLRRGIDGWRTDVTRWVTDEFWRRFRKAVRAVNPEAYLVAEEWEDASDYLLGDMYDAAMNYRFAWAVLGFLAFGEISASEFDDRLATLRRDTPPEALLSQMNLIDSHDTKRALSACQGDKHRYLQVVAFQFAYPGSPLIYYGDEAGLEGEYAEAGRRAFPWGHEDEEISEFYRRALAARKKSRALRLGSVESVLINDKQRVYVMVRRFEGETVYAAFNASDKPATVEIPVQAGDSGRWEDALGEHPAIEVQAGGAAQLSLEIGPRGAAWYVRST